MASVMGDKEDGKRIVSRWIEERLNEIESESSQGMSRLSETRSIPGMEHYAMTRRGLIRNTKRGNRLVRPSLNNHGYLMYDLRANTVAKKTTAHKMVAEVWLPPCDDSARSCIDHIDGNRLNNSPTNLRWTSLAENNSNLHSAKPRKAGGIHSSYRGVYWDSRRSTWATTYTILEPDGTRKVKHKRSASEAELAEFRNYRHAELVAARTNIAAAKSARDAADKEDVVKLLVENMVLQTVIKNS